MEIREIYKVYSEMLCKGDIKMPEDVKEDIEVEFEEVETEEVAYLDEVEDFEVEEQEAEDDL